MAMSKKAKDALLKQQRKEGSRGGKKTLALYGKNHFSKIAEARWKNHKKKK